MSLDSYITLGHSGLHVSPLCLGTMTFGEDWGWGSSPAESEAILSAYLEQGGNFIDTANLYTNGHSEKIIGDFFARRKGRDRSVIATKFFGNLHAGDPNGGGNGRKAIIEQCEASLRRLQTDYIDLYWIHNWEPSTPIEETMRTLDDLVRAGKIRYIGISDAPAWKTAQAQTIAQFRGWAPLIALQLEYSLLQRTVEGELMPMARELHLGAMPWSPLKGGWLSGKYTRENAGVSQSERSKLVGASPSEQEYQVIDVVKAIAAERQSTPAAVALAWVQGRAGVASTLIGARRLEQLQDNLSSLTLKLTVEEVARLDQVTKPALNFPADVNEHLAPMLAFAGAKVDGRQTTVLPWLTASSTRY
ncbi:MULTISPECIES: aldo/keto reductase [unclassified Janthinobacterium]|uniref:aldo/keto reductase n=1 Tax=unclassified Janthinobacterium TaxID=2610881 RepID=UPI001618595F|nr:MULTISPECIES: aldo/keto reductase [unclassified Janthinobacterium]MBB5609099.1 aryl-alcohol dehydrogenase-like predicted oxidoreductase [Janthinobacterium sp. S3T4]MBB5614170.1 aryl-alcohol dehydrogenase-like predicted oxidoreductase [Janthinobacterium sp. S3M3]